MFKRLLLSTALFLSAGSVAPAQSLWPMTDEGVTFAAKKGVMINIANPYPRAENFVLEAFEPDYETPTEGVLIMPAKVTLGADATRRVRVIFDIPGKERTVAVCVRPEKSEGQVIPRVCGRYSGRRAGAQ